MNEGFIYAVGIGPGSSDLLTPMAVDALERSRIVAGYPPYLELIKEFIKGKETISTGMRAEVERCEKALDAAQAGQVVSVVSSGDAGVYAMAGLLFELNERRGDSVRIEVVPGVSASNAAAAALGAPLMSDYATISLSDLLTPTDVIRKRLKAVAEADMVCAVYNPAGRKRRELLTEMIAVFKEKGGSDLVCGYVKHASRPNQTIWLGTISEFPFDEIDMSTLVIMGNSRTEIINGKMVTRRGYRMPDEHGV